MTTLHLRKLIGRSLLPRHSFREGRSLLTVSHWRHGLLFIPLALCYFALSPALHAVTPAPDGGYPGANTAEGQDALFSNTSGPWNTALGFQALHGNTTGNSNTAEGYHALFTNTAGSGNTANGGLALFSNTTGSHNTANGVQALYGNTTGASNTADGFQALAGNSTGVNNVADGLEALFHNTTGSYNTATGYQALLSNTTGATNTAVGRQALYSNTDGNGSTAVGYGALGFNTATGNTATGFQALLNNTTSGSNTANGYQALYSNTGGSQNTATGWVALFNNTTGSNNTANGSQALYSNTIGRDNTATGFGALYFNTANYNTATGFQALNSNTTGNSNNAVGYQALYNNTTGVWNNAFGYQALVNNVTGNYNTAIGDSAGSLVTGTGNVCIGEGIFGVAGEDNTTRIRNVYATVQPVVGTDPDYVTVDSTGRLGRANISSRRYKHDIKPMDKASEAIFALQPVTFRYKREFDPTQTLAYGLIAEEVAKLSPDLVGRDREGQPESVRYEQINAMLLNEFLKEHRKVEEQDRTMQEQKAEIIQLKSALTKQGATIAEQQKGFESKIAHQQTQIETLTAGLQKVSAQVEMSRPSPQMVLSTQ